MLTLLPSAEFAPTVQSVKVMNEAERSPLKRITPWSSPAHEPPPPKLTRVKVVWLAPLTKRRACRRTPRCRSETGWLWPAPELPSSQLVPAPAPTR